MGLRRNPLQTDQDPLDPSQTNALRTTSGFGNIQQPDQNVLKAAAQAPDTQVLDTPEQVVAAVPDTIQTQVAQGPTPELETGFQPVGLRKEFKPDAEVQAPDAPPQEEFLKGFTADGQRITVNKFEDISDPLIQPIDPTTGARIVGPKDISSFLQNKRDNLIGAVPAGVEATGFKVKTLGERLQEAKDFAVSTGFALGDAAAKGAIPGQIDPIMGGTAEQQSNSTGILASIVDSFPQNQNQSNARSNIDGMMNELLENSILNFTNLSDLNQQSQEYISQLMTGQTEATRALQSKEASAMAQGIQSLMNNIGQQAASAGITGGELQRLYDFGIAKVADTMRNFALDNIIRMSETQQLGFENFLNSMKLGQDSISALVSDVSLLKQMDVAQTQADDATINNLVALSSTDPVAFEIVSAWMIYKQNVPEASVSGFLETFANNPDVQAAISRAQADSYDISDITRLSLIYKDLGLPFLIAQELDSNGNGLETSDGQPVLKIFLGSDLKLDNGKWRILTGEQTEAGEGGGELGTTPVAGGEELPALPGVTGLSFDAPINEPLGPQTPPPIIGPTFPGPPGPGVPGPTTIPGPVIP